MMLLWSAAATLLPQPSRAEILSMWNGNTGWNVINCGPNPTDCPRGMICSDSPGRVDQCVASGSTTQPSCAGCNYGGGTAVQCMVVCPPKSQLSVSCADPWTSLYQVCAAEGAGDCLPALNSSCDQTPMQCVDIPCKVAAGVVGVTSGSGGSSSSAIDLIPAASYPPFPHGYLYDLAFNNHEYKAYFHEQWSYNQHTQAGEQKHFAIETCRGRPALRIGMYEHDIKFSPATGDNFPRTELNGGAAPILEPDRPYCLRWNWVVDEYDLTAVPGYMFGFLQLFANSPAGPNIMLRWELGRYFLYCDACRKTLALPGSIKDDIGVWGSWQLDFVLSTNASLGYIRVFKDGKAVGAFEGVTSKSSGHHVKTGIYTQHNATNVLNTSTCTENFKLLNLSAQAHWQALQ